METQRIRELAADLAEDLNRPAPDASPGEDDLVVGRGWAEELVAAALGAHPAPEPHFFDSDDVAVEAWIEGARPWCAECDQPLTRAAGALGP